MSDDYKMQIYFNLSDEGGYKFGCFPPSRLQIWNALSFQNTW